MRRSISTLVLSAALIGSPLAALANTDEASNSGSGYTTSSDTTGSSDMTGVYGDDSDMAGQEAGEIAESDDTGSGYSEDMGEAGTAGDMSTTASQSDMQGGLIRNEVLGIKPQVGILSFDNANGENDTRGAAGLTIDLNMTQAIAGIFGAEDAMSNLYVGPSTGLIYSHLGAPNANFIGNSDSGNAGAGANLFYIPANLKVGVNLGDALRVSAHGGGNVVYRSIENSARLGANQGNNAGNDWTIFPNVGADVELGLGENANILLRPDWTLTEGPDMFTGTLGLVIGLS